MSATLLVSSLSASAATAPSVGAGTATCQDSAAGGEPAWWLVTWPVTVTVGTDPAEIVIWQAPTAAPSAGVILGYATEPGSTVAATTTIQVSAEMPAGFVGTVALTANITVDGAPLSGTSTDVSLDGSCVDAAPVAPTAPTAINASNVTQTSVNLSWSGATGNITGYKVFRCSGSGCNTFTTQVGGTITGTSFQNTGLTANTVYRYKVKATGPGGDSPLSTYTREIATPAAAPTTVQTTTTSAPPPTTPPVTTAAAVATTTLAPVGGQSSGLGARQVASSDDSSGPSTLLILSTAGILVAFVVALVFLMRERRMLKREADYDDDDYDDRRGGYWGDYHTQLR